MLKTYTGNKVTSLTNYAWKKWATACQRIKLDQYLSSCTKLTPSGSKTLNLKPETLIMF